ncbi:hypothetical protein GLP21_17575 [Photobacterium carnosum]|uniref:PRTRC system protein B n=1 Tax=Photobacterium carnosum TaxID=2023717 RepID=A0A2N4UWG2_9GAMM|nr:MULTISPECIES: hypothetical protein [Photobacterium]MCD9488089.1 hypothetical protein [Photobacterium iliopiscarium]MCD9476313.1 hypothetical protein [Photobacterium phosphoreum]MCD9508089.1 hypothetical protein [Photobacterium phosphoreum]MCD9539172.1 hypothetical protein [Photobacterium carnosum]MCD9542336.1 hypothetical protein [Photobacterium carnosum]
MALTVQNEVTDISSQQTVAQPKSAAPDFAIVFYSGTIGQEFMTRHSFNKQNEMGIGELIDGEQLHSIFNNVHYKIKSEQKEKKVKQLIPDNVLFDDFEQMIWYTKSQTRPMWFRFAGLPPFCCNVVWTPMLWSLDKTNKRLHVFALDSNDRPTLDTCLYLPPLPNVNAHGYLCQGTANLPTDLNFSNIQNIEATLFDSAFAHWWNNQPFTSYDPAAPVKDSLNFWRKRDGKDMPVEIEELISLNIKVSDLM